MKVLIETLGCKVNQLESQAIANMFVEKDYEIVFTSPADIIIINSCTVTSQADKKAVSLLHKLRKLNPNAIIALTGCMPQVSENIYEKFPEADIITGNENRRELFNLILNYVSRTVSVPVHNAYSIFEPLVPTFFDSRFQKAYIKIEDGCDRFCSYCIIPMARGKVRSLSENEILSQANALINNGYKEIVLTGINLSKYGVDISSDLLHVVKSINTLTGDFRIRLGSLEPDLLSEKIIAGLSECEKLCPQFHLALQSGSDNILSKMNRHYTTSEFKNICNLFKAYFKNPSFTTDVMVGFPGETDSDFQSTCNFIKEIGFLRTHVFTYSPRPNTVAYSMKNQIPKSISSERSKKLHDLCNKVAQDKASEFIGKTIRVLAEADESGYSDNYAQVSIPDFEKHIGNFINIKVTSSKDSILYGTII